MRDVIIVGGGISGLAVAHYLKEHARITLIEATDRLGGWVHTINKKGFVFEGGPRGFRPAGKGEYTLALAQQLGLTPIAANPKAKTRYVVKHGKLHPVSLPFLLKNGLLRGLIKDLCQKPSRKQDETIAEFCRRHFGNPLTKQLVDPLVRGIFGGDYRTLSARSCFPTLWQTDQEIGSLIRGRKKTARPPASLYSFQEGMETLIHALSKTPMQVRFHSQVTHIQEGKVFLKNDMLETETILLAVSPRVLQDVMDIKDPHTYATISIVAMGWHTDVNPMTGYGFLVPSYETEGPLMGMTFDSDIFPQQGAGTRLTVMLEGDLSKERMIDQAIRAARHFCRIEAPPEIVHCMHAKNAITQYMVGHSQWLHTLQHTLPKNVYALGSGLHGVGINDCIFDAFSLAQALIQSWQSSPRAQTQMQQS